MKIGQAIVRWYSQGLRWLLLQCVGFIPTHSYQIQQHLRIRLQSFQGIGAPLPVWMILKRQILIVFASYYYEQLCSWLYIYSLVESVSWKGWISSCRLMP